MVNVFPRHRKKETAEQVTWESDERGDGNWEERGRVADRHF